MLIAGVFEVAIVTVAAVVVGGAIGLWLLSRFVRIVQQGSVGVVKRLGEFRGVMQPGMHILTPFIDKMDKVDVREFPMTGDQQAVITKDNVSLQVERDHLLPGDRRQVGALRDQRLPAGGRPALAHRPAGRVRRALARPGAQRARADQQPHAGPHGGRHGEVGRAAQPDRDPRHHPAPQRDPGDVRAEGGRAAQAGRHPQVRGRAASGREPGRRAQAGGGARGGRRQAGGDPQRPRPR